MPSNLLYIIMLKYSIIKTRKNVLVSTLTIFFNNVLSKTLRGYQDQNCIPECQQNNLNVKLFKQNFIHFHENNPTSILPNYNFLRAI